MHRPNLIQEELNGEFQMAAVAQLAEERCQSIHSLLFVYELLLAVSCSRAGRYIALEWTSTRAQKGESPV